MKDMHLFLRMKGGVSRSVMGELRRRNYQLNQCPVWAGCSHPCRRQPTQNGNLGRCTAASQLRAQTPGCCALRQGRLWGRPKHRVRNFGSKRIFDRPSYIAISCWVTLNRAGPGFETANNMRRGLLAKPAHHLKATHLTRYNSFGRSGLRP